MSEDQISPFEFGKLCGKIDEFMEHAEARDKVTEQNVSDIKNTFTRIDTSIGVLQAKFNDHVTSNSKVVNNIVEQMKERDNKLSFKIDESIAQMQRQCVESHEDVVPNYIKKSMKNVKVMIIGIISIISVVSGGILSVYKLVEAIIK